MRDSAESVFHCRPLTGNKKMSFLCDLGGLERSGREKNIISV
jgi:hypothetical protein